MYVMFTEHALSHLSERKGDLKQDGTKKPHNFLAQFFMPFLMVWYVLFELLALKTPKLKLCIGCEEY